MAARKQTVNATQSNDKSTDTISENNLIDTKDDKIPSVVKETPKKTAKKYEPDDLIMCRSMYAGTLLFTGLKSKQTYEFCGIGDTRYIEYQDLQAAMITRKQNLYAPYIIIEDEELLEDVHWKSLRDLYDSMYDESDIEDLLNLPTIRFKEEFKKLPVGFKKTVSLIVSTRVQEGTFDSVNKISIIDELCGTDIKCLIK